MEYINRKLAAVLTKRMRDEPAILLQGPRASGKSTVLEQIANSSKCDVIDLSNEDLRTVIQQDPAAFFNRSRYPRLIDEYQLVPEVLAVVKRDVDRTQRPGSYVLAGSTTADLLPRGTETLTGRLHQLTMYGFSQGEIDGVDEQFIDRAFAKSSKLIKLDYRANDRDEYSKRIVRGGFPVAVARSGQSRRRWLLDYAASVIDRDLADLVQLKQPAVFRQVLRICAARTSQILNVNGLASDLGAGRVAVGTYIELLERVFLVTRLCAFSANLSARVVKHPKLHVNDTGMAAALANIDSSRLATSTDFGPYLESFVFGEILKQREWAKHRIEIFHFRTHDDHEVDFVLEDENGNVVGIEVKSKRSVESADLRGLRVLADHLGTRFVHGYVLYTGDHATTYAGDKRFSAVPVSALWT